MGREAMLDEVKWKADGWPAINSGKGPSGRAPSPFGVADLNAECSFLDQLYRRATAARLAVAPGQPTSNPH